MSERTCCVIEDGKVCGRPVEGRGWCSMHYQRWQNNGDPLISKRPRQQPVCTEPDCGKPSYQKSRCLKHYREWQASQRGPCSVDDCEEPWKSNGLCGTHYTRWRRTGSTDAPAPTGRPCSVEGCTERTRAHEYCQKHYRNWRKHGTPIPPAKPEKAPVPCSVGRCDAMAIRKNGMCDYHYRKSIQCTKPTCRQEGCEAPVRVRSRACADHGGELSATLARAYNITTDSFYTMLEAQNGGCAVCGRRPEEVPGRVKRLVIDHDHQCCPAGGSCGKCVRGLLCNPCNHLLGIAADNPTRLIAAIRYLERTRSAKPSKGNVIPIRSRKPHEEPPGAVTLW